MRELLLGLTLLGALALGRVLLEVPLTPGGRIAPVVVTGPGDLGPNGHTLKLPPG